MTERRRYKPYDWEPLTMTPAEVAEVVFRRSESWLLDHPPPAGFPAPVDGLYSTEAVRDWVRARHGLAVVPSTPQATEQFLLGRVKDGTRARAIPRRA